MKTSYSQVALVDNGGYFPELDNQKDYSWFLMDGMKLLGTDAVGVGERDLHFGLGYLKWQVKRTGLPVICSNLMEKATGKPAFQPYVVKQVGSVKLGVFALIGAKINLGPSGDSLTVADPATVAEQMVAELHRKGATVVLLLSQLGKVESEDLVSTVNGIDAVMVGHDVPLIQNGRMIKNTVACYGGEQGQYVCKSVLTLDAKKHVTTGEATTVILSPEVGENADVLKLVKSFEDGFNDKMRKQEMEKAKQHETVAADNSPDHYVGATLCIRCHEAEGDQWKTTAHSVAWQTLVELKKEATPECVPCHVMGYGKAGGFDNEATTPQRVNVQCENCHGMGTAHDAFSSNAMQVTEQTCRGCHNSERDPDFNWAKKLPLIVHSNMSGVTLKNRNVQGNAPKMMKSGGSR